MFPSGIIIEEDFPEYKNIQLSPEYCKKYLEGF